MGPKYETNVQELGAALFTDAGRAARLTLDVVDDHIDSGKLEPIEDAVAEAARAYLEHGLRQLQERGGTLAKFAGDVCNDAEAAVDAIIDAAEQRITDRRLAPLAAGAAELVRPYLVQALAAKQRAMAAATITAED